ncbi:MAG TPA: riboflavin synthase [Steroidobacteraceae bacterium]|nr:riboflavin synthase [Steroidobacteraceae bacterium]
MFTGIVRVIGHVVSVRQAGGALELEIGCGRLPSGTWKAGDSICVAGVCLTVSSIGPESFRSVASAETLGCTTLGRLSPGDPVNLEPALASGGLLGGHFVTGHVDGVARIDEAREVAGSLRFVIAPPPSVARLVASKGSVTIDGVSLTVNEVAGETFGVNVVPHTRAATTLGSVRKGQAVNLEVDILARYLERLLDQRVKP